MLFNACLSVCLVRISLLCLAVYSYVFFYLSCSKACLQFALWLVEKTGECDGSSGGYIQNSSSDR